MTSGDGLRWNRHSGTGDAYLYAVSFTGREFVAVGCNGRAASSIDGQIWRPLELEGRGDLIGVAGTPERMVAFGVTGAIVLPSADPASPVLSLKVSKSGIDGNSKLIKK